MWKGDKSKHRQTVPSVWVSRKWFQTSTSFFHPIFTVA